jgi:hypothetical protein
MAATPTGTKRVNFNVEEAKYEDWQSWSATSGFTVTEMLTFAMALYGEAQKAQAAGGQLILVTGDGQSKAITLPTKAITIVNLPGAVPGLTLTPAESTPGKSEKVGTATI